MSEAHIYLLNVVRNISSLTVVNYASMIIVFISVKHLKPRGKLVKSAGESDEKLRGKVTQQKMPTFCLFLSERLPSSKLPPRKRQL